MRNIGIEFVAKGMLAFRDLGKAPEPGPTEMLLETVFTGITNGTERHAFLVEHGFGGGRFPSHHGYQHVSRIVATGDKVTHFGVGDTVFYGGYVGHNGWNLVDEGDLLVRLPETIDHRYCALFGVAGVALRAVRRMGVSQGDNVWVAGQGPIGHFVAQAAKSAGAMVTVSDLIPKRLDAARACGAHVVLNAGESETPRTIEEGGPYDYIYDCCSAEKLLSDIHENQLLAHGGTVGMMAVRDKVIYPWGLLHSTEAKIETSCHFDRDDLRVLLFLHEKGLLRIEPVVSHSVSIDEAPRIYGKLARNDDDILGVIFDWTEDSAACQ